MKQHWLTRPETIRKLWFGSCGVLVLTVLAQLPFHIKAHFPFEGWFGFAAGFGFLSCVAMVLLAKLLGVVLKRRDTYYDD
ncbi:MAG: hypothetical protein OEM59_02095 [Rhodospirillales bacterium]|nr:hypothetical protein [Rhodospirillales bacterium]